MIANKHATPLNELAIFSGIPANQIHELIQGGVAVSSKHRGVLFRAGEPAPSFMIVLIGAYKLFRQDLSGNETIMYFAGPGDLIGGPIMVRPEPIYPISAASIGESMVLRIPRETYLKSWANNVKLQQKLNEILFFRMNHIQEEKTSQRLPLAVKLALLLMTLVERYSNGSDHILPLPITRQELADSVGATVESVIRMLGEWNSAGILKLESRQIEVADLDRLFEVARGESSKD